MNKILKIYKYIGNLPRRVLLNFILVTLISAVLTSITFVGLGLSFRIWRWWWQPNEWIAEQFAKGRYSCDELALEAARKGLYPLYILSLLFVLWLFYAGDLKPKLVRKKVQIEKGFSERDIYSPLLYPLIDQIFTITKEVITTKDSSSLTKLREKIRSQIVNIRQHYDYLVKDLEQKVRETEESKRYLLGLSKLPNCLYYKHRATSSIISCGAVVGLLSSVFLSRFTDHILSHILFSASTSLAFGGIVGFKLAFVCDDEGTKEAISYCKDVLRELKSSQEALDTEEVVNNSQKHKVLEEKLNELKSLLSKEIESLKQYDYWNLPYETDEDSSLSEKTVTVKIDDKEYTVTKTESGVSVIYNNEVIFDNTKTPPILKIDPNLLTKIVKTL